MSEKKKNQVDNPDLPIEEQVVAQIKAVEERETAVAEKEAAVETREAAVEEKETALA